MGAIIPRSAIGRIREETADRTSPERITQKELRRDCGVNGAIRDNVGEHDGA